MPGQSGPPGAPEAAHRRSDGDGRKRENGHSLPGSGAWAGRHRVKSLKNQYLKIYLARLTLAMGVRGRPEREWPRQYGRRLVTRHMGEAVPFSKAKHRFAPPSGCPWMDTRGLREAGLRSAMCSAAGGGASGKIPRFLTESRVDRAGCPDPAPQKKCRHSGHRATAIPIPTDTMSSRVSVSPMRKRCMDGKVRPAGARAMIVLRRRG